MRGRFREATLQANRGGVRQRVSAALRQARVVDVNQEAATPSYEDFLRPYFITSGLRSFTVAARICSPEIS